MPLLTTAVTGPLSDGLVLPPFSTRLAVSVLPSRFVVGLPYWSSVSTSKPKSLPATTLVGGSWTMDNVAGPATTLIVPVWPGVTLLPVACKTYEPAVSRITAGKDTVPFEGTSGPAPLIGKYPAGPVNTDSITAPV